MFFGGGMKSLFSLNLCLNGLFELGFCEFSWIGLWELLLHPSKAVFLSTCRLLIATASHGRHHMDVNIWTLTYENYSIGQPTDIFSFIQQRVGMCVSTCYNHQ